MASATAFSPNQSSLLIPSVSSNPFLVSQISKVPSLSAKSSGASHMNMKLKLPPTPRASAEGVPSELIEDSKFVPLNADDPTYGPPALLLLGFEVEEAVKVRQLLKELDGEFLEVAESLPRICFLSGLNGEDMMMFIDAFPEKGLEPAVFAALVPNSADKPLQELMEEIMGDHEMLTGGQSG